MILADLGTGTRHHDSVVVKMDTNENVVLTFIVIALFPFITEL